MKSKTYIVAGLVTLGFLVLTAAVLWLFKFGLNSIVDSIILQSDGLSILSFSLVVVLAISSIYLLVLKTLQYDKARDAASGRGL